MSSPAGEKESHMQGTQLRYVIKFVADMDKAVKFHRDVLGLQLKFESPGKRGLYVYDTVVVYVQSPMYDLATALALITEPLSMSGSILIGPTPPKVIS
jgi:catechol 2,3-dioxygenase-like lactoylglutathione lyase family enzyme